jgi:hypothetical protein
VGDALMNKRNNRRISWQYVEAPNYSGDIEIYFIPQSQLYWGGIVITNLPNGIHGVERDIAGTWTRVGMLTDEGQVYMVIQNSSTEDSGQFRIRVHDAADQLIHGGRVYQLAFPCSGT